MNNPNPFVPQGSVLEQNKRRSRMKFAVLGVLAVSVCGLTAMLIQGCKNEKTTENLPPVEPATSFATDTNLSPAMVSTGAPPTTVSNIAPSAAYVPPVVTPVVPEPTGSEYVVVKGDSLSKIKTKFGVTLKALEAANPGVQPTKLKVGQKLTIPAGGSAAPAATGGSASPDMTASGGQIYVVKSHDTMSKIATAHGVSLKDLKAANPNVDPSHIKVGQKLKIPAKAEAAAPASTAAPAPATTPVEPVTPVTTPAPAATPAGH